MPAVMGPPAASLGGPLDLFQIVLGAPALLGLSGGVLKNGFGVHRLRGQIGCLSGQMANAACIARSGLHSPTVWPDRFLASRPAPLARLKMADDDC